MPNVSIKKWFVIIMAAFFIAGAAIGSVGYAEYVNPAIADKDSPSYWMDQAGLFSTYGNYPAAVRAYEKALALDSRNSEAYFGLGVALGALGDYNGAMANIDRAIGATPGNGRYLYGRAWVLMLSGRSGEALSVFRKASDLGDIDAQSYLNFLASLR